MRVPSPSRPAPTPDGPSRSSPGRRRSAGSSSGRRPGLPVEVGDQLRIYPGCHKRVLEDCRDRFRIPGSLLFDKGNARNFRGEPYVPGSPLTAVQAGRGPDALGAHLLDRPLRADRRRRLRLRSDRGGGRRAARRLSVRLQRTEDRGAAPWRPRGQLEHLWRGDPGRVRRPEGRGRDDLGDRHRRGQEHQEGRRQPVRRRPEDRRVPVFRQLRGRVRRGAGRRGLEDLGRRQADRGSARGRRRLRQPPEVQFPDLPGHRGPGAGPADPAPRRGASSGRPTRRRRSGAWSTSCSRTCRSTSSATASRRSPPRSPGRARRRRWSRTRRSCRGPAISPAVRSSIRSGGFSTTRRRRTGLVAFAPPAWSRTCGCPRPSSAST